MRTHVQTAGVSLTAQQPLNNITRTAIEALAGVLGGTQSLHTNSWDEALALPTENAVRIALRTQQIIAHETGVTNTIDPLGGSYFVEALTDEIEAQAYDYFAKIDELGGMVEAVKRGFPQREIADAAYTLQQEYDSRARIMVGVNDFTEGEGGELELHRVDPAIERKQTDRVQGVRARRDSAAAESRAGRAARGRGGRGQPDAEPSRLRARTRHRGRDRREPSAGLRHLHRNASLLRSGTMRKLIVIAIAACSARRARRHRDGRHEVGQGRRQLLRALQRRAEGHRLQGHDRAVALRRRHAPTPSPGQRARGSTPACRLGDVPARRCASAAPTRSTA